MMKFIYPLLLLTGLLFPSCTKDEEVSEIDYSRFKDAEIIRDIKINYSDSAHLKALIKGPKLLRYDNGDREVFPEGIHATFFNSLAQPNSQLTANHAVRYQRKNQIVVNDHVILFNESGDSLFTSQLTWDEKQDKIYTKRFVKLTKKDKVIMGYGFESNQDFTKGQIKAIEGTWSLNNK